MAKSETKTTATTAYVGANKEVSETKRIVPIITTVTSAVPMPTRINNRGSKSIYDFEGLATVGASFGVKNKTAKQIASVVSNANKKYLTPKLDGEGKIVYKTTKATDGEGKTIEIATSEAVMIASKHFFADDCDPAKDPDGATVRVFRDK